jgi:hypothetical protein
MPNAIELLGSLYPIYKAANSTFSADTFRCAEETVTELLATATTSDNPGSCSAKCRAETRTPTAIDTIEPID